MYEGTKLYSTKLVSAPVLMNWLQDALHKNETPKFHLKEEGDKKKKLTITAQSDQTSEE